MIFFNFNMPDRYIRGSFAGDLAEGDPRVKNPVTSPQFKKGRVEIRSPTKHTKEIP
jgi:hypothetical protein